MNEYFVYFKVETFFFAISSNELKIEGKFVKIKEHMKIHVYRATIYYIISNF